MDAAIPLQHTFVSESKHINGLLESQRHICSAFKKLVYKVYNDFENWLSRDQGNLNVIFVTVV